MKNSSNSNTSIVSEETKFLELKNHIINLCKYIPNDQKLGETIRKYCLENFNYLNKK